MASCGAVDPVTVSEFFSSEYTQTAASALVCYEYLITFSDEVNTVWGQKLTPVSLLLVSIRYTILTETIFILLPAAAELQAYAHRSASLCPAWMLTSRLLLRTSCLRHLRAEFCALCDGLRRRRRANLDEYLRAIAVLISLP
ncbi:hypothetical protein PsYK624_013990 [Phanerochaete sordida]|uniref:DUF6533 domain-containing protein n=1 Tax=Phanerochaete sordida TaxID=48140 RepID=A0A9P3G062_9APHY|nr:hypothetical protein PsYK624_013990 [Phanerochaete sordida]